MTTSTFVFADEDHTLGNALRYCISRHPDVQMVGYDVPHPAEEKLQIRIQTNGRDPSECLVDSAKALESIADTYLQQLAEYL
ncbi:DNA-directed_RNA polymerases I and III 16 kDa polypeptide [Hexamita inflata]|uniref:DNA-directed RNA polymerases I and III 16 kDa polypeptide n=1 Tax=Hexamita inflata TaxID=28002 RepID=A0AA86NIV7_9EUKA|nr:DNA-directed RNA polymerases I and III 16 kDa polypeptide [Hexamita inflata]